MEVDSKVTRLYYSRMLILHCAKRTHAHEINLVLRVLLLVANDTIILKSTARVVDISTSSILLADGACAVLLFLTLKVHLSDCIDAKLLAPIVFVLICALTLRGISLDHSHIVSILIIDCRYLSNRFWRFTNISYSF